MIWQSTVQLTLACRLEQCVKDARRTCPIRQTLEASETSIQSQLQALRMEAKVTAAWNLASHGRRQQHKVAAMLHEILGALPQQLASSPQIKQKTHGPVCSHGKWP